MPLFNFNGYPLIKIDGTQAYAEGVGTCLAVIKNTQDGRALLDKLNTSGFKVTIKDTTSGNSQTSDVQADGVPKLCRAIDSEDSALFATELEAALKKAEAAGITRDHYARQLANGLTPATYLGDDNSVRPTTKWQAVKPSILGGLTQEKREATAAQKTLEKANSQAEKVKKLLAEFASGQRQITKLPEGWDYELPRLLRTYLAPGPGTGSTVNFNPTATFHCKGDPAMHNRPPAIGLAHELIHALHAAEGVDMWWVVKGGHRLEEVITTGMAPYQYEEISDNKMRTQWPTDIALRKDYTTKAGTTKARYGVPT